MAPLSGPRYNDPLSLILYNNAQQAAFRSYGRYLQDGFSRYVNRAQTESSYRRNVTIERRLTQDAELGMTFLASVSMKDVLAQSVQYVDTATREYIEATSKVYSQSIRESRPRFRAAYEQVAAGAREATLRRYKATRVRPKGIDSESDAFRKGAKNYRYSGGKLEAALGSPLLTEVGTDGIGFPNMEFLDRTARQWARLNFGAGQRGTQSRSLYGGNRIGHQDRTGALESYGVKFFTSEIGGQLNDVASGVRLSLKGYVPRTMIIPGGVWFQGGIMAGHHLTAPNGANRGTDTFVPASALNGVNIKGAQRKLIQRRRVSQGIAAAGFLDAGLSYIAENAPAVTAAILLEGFDKTPGSRPADKIAISNANSAKIEAQLRARIEKYLAAGSSIGKARANLLSRL